MLPNNKKGYLGWDCFFFLPVATGIGREINPYSSWVTFFIQSHPWQLCRPSFSGTGITALRQECHLMIVIDLKKRSTACSGRVYYQKAASDLLLMLHINLNKKMTRKTSFRQILQSSWKSSLEGSMWKVSMTIKIPWPKVQHSEPALLSTCTEFHTGKDLCEASSCTSFLQWKGQQHRLVPSRRNFTELRNVLAMAAYKLVHLSVFCCV